MEDPSSLVDSEGSWEDFRGGDWRDEHDDEGGERQWGKKKKRGKGSRRGLRAKKRSL